MKRKIIKIAQDKCTGCGLCLPNCPEGALQIIDGKARLISDLFCDGLGACIGHCPEGAITTEEREAESYDEKKVMANIVKQGKNVIKAHLEHLKSHNEQKYLQQAVDYLKENNIDNLLKADLKATDTQKLPCACPGAKLADFRDTADQLCPEENVVSQATQLRQWPVQLMLVPAVAPFLKDANLLIAADCVPFAYANFHQDLLRDKILLVGCPKLDDSGIYQEKIIQIVKNNNLKSITHVHMEVPCCFGLVNIIKSAISLSGKDVPFKELVVSIKGDRFP